MKKGLIILLVIIVVIVLFGGCGAVSFQRNAVSKEENIKGKWANVQSDYQRRADLIPNLVNTVKGVANFEQQTLTQVVEARASATKVNIDASNLTPENIARFQQAQAQLGGALSRLLVTIERYPELKATQNFRDLQTQLEGTENRIKVARNDFNSAVQDFNAYIRRFPNNFYSGFMGFASKGYFEAEAGSEQAPTVDFGTNQPDTSK